MTYATLERELYIEATPEIVFQVVSDPAHVKHWWPDDARYEVTPGATGEIVFGDCNHGGTVVPFTVLDVQPPRTFSFRWIHAPGDVAAQGNSLLVTFELTPQGSGTLLKLTESGFREMGWDDAVLDGAYVEHEQGWDLFLPRIAPYVASLELQR